MKVLRSLSCVALIGLCILSGLFGCGRTTAHARTTETVTVNLEPMDYRWIKYVKGEDCVGRFLVFFRFDSPSPVAASRHAMQQTPEANLVINRHTKIREVMWVPLVYHRICSHVEGLAITLRDASMRPAGGS